jgi:hypothetical protein
MGLHIIHNAAFYKRMRILFEAVDVILQRFRAKQQFLDRIFHAL